jgi:glyoxylase-like metal-dependent hydrolase (beta-lactamase superfamily II)
MSEPRTRAERVVEVAPGILGWSVHDDRIDARSDGYAILERAGAVLIDPLPLADDQLDRLGSVRAICLTGACHQRSAWRYRRRFGAKVHAPAGALGLEERPDATYHAGYRLPGGLSAIHAPGPAEVHYAFLRPDGGGALFCADVLVHLEPGRLRFADDAYQDMPERTRQTAARFLELTFAALCPAHGAPITRGARDAILRAVHPDRPGRRRA